MPLSCGCDYDGDFEWWYEVGDFAPLATRNRRRCKSCKQPIDVGAEAIKIMRSRNVVCDFDKPPTVEEKIYGEDGQVPMAPWYLCERCGGIFASLTELGFCMQPDDNMDSLLAEYHRDYAKPPAPGFGLKIKERI